MKLALTIILMLASVAVAKPTTRPVDTSRLDQIIDEAQGVKADNRRLEDQLADANHSLLSVDAAWQKTLAGEREASNKAKAELKKKLDWYQNNRWVAAALWIRGAVYWIVGVYFALSVIALIGGLMSPAGMFFKLAQTIISVLPFANWIEWFHSTIVVKARTIPVVARPVVVAPASTDVVADNTAGA